MKNKTTLLILLGLLSFGWTGWSQDKPAAATSPTNAAPTGEVVPLITFDETPLADVIKALARQANINYQLDPKVTAADAQGKSKATTPVSLRFENVTAEQALMAVLENHDMQLVRDTKSPIARITSRDPAALEPLVTKIYQMEFANVSNIVEILRPTLGQRSKAIADGRTGKLVVVATEKELAPIDILLTQLDSATRQVLIEGKIIETSRNPRSVRGIDWSGTFETQNIRFGNNNVNGIVPSANGVVAGRFPGGPFQFMPAAAFLNADGVNAVLSFINKDNDSEILSMPRTVTQDNIQARLEVTRAFPIFKATPGSANVPPSAEITYTNLGTILLVTPRISSYSNINLKVIPEVSDIAGVDRKILFNQPFEANIYSIRRLETTVMIPSGYTLVLGGMVAGDSKRDYTKVPILGDIPGLGLAFRSQNKRKLKTNLLLFITPTIVENTDYQKTDTTFLQTPVIEDVDEPLPKIDSAKPLGSSKTR